MPVKPPAPRHTVQKEAEGICITLPSKKNVISLFANGLAILFWGFMMVLIIVLIVGGFWGASTNISNDNLSPFFVFSALLLVYFLGLLAFIGMAIYSFFWIIVGKEIFKVSHSTLTITQKIFGWDRSKEYALDTVLDLRVNPIPLEHYNPVNLVRNLLGINIGMIAFDYGAKTFRFGQKIDEAEAKQIIAALRLYLSKTS